LCAAVVFNACYVITDQQQRGGLGGSDADVSEDLALYEQFVEQVNRIGASGRCKLLVKALHASELYYLGGLGLGDTNGESQLRTGVMLYEKLASETDRPHEKFRFLYEAARGASDFTSPDAILIHRKLLARIMTDCPNHPRRPEARLMLLKTYIDAGKPAEALAQTRAWDEAGERDLGPELHAIAVDHLRRKELRIAQTLCEEITARYPDGAASGAAYLTLAQLHGAAGREEESIAAYKQAAVAKSVETHANLMDGGNTRSHAHEFLGEYYMQKEDWQEALYWWQNWEPTSWCGNCLIDMHSRRNKQMDVCRKKLEPTSPSP
jgi:hypothetical protein